MSHTSCTQAPEFPQSHFGDDRESTLLSWLYMCNAYFASARFEHFVCRPYLSIILVIWLIWKSRSSLGQTLIKIKYKVKGMVKFREM